MGKKEREINRKLLQKETQLVDFKGGGDVRLVLAYPNRYWLAMSNLGFQTVYRCFREEARYSVERAYIPEADDDIKTFESGRNLGDAEILAISISFETDYPYVLKVIEAAGGLDEAQAEHRPLIIGGGAAITLNPEPLANFFDALVIGEAEEVIKEINRVYLQAREDSLSRQDLLLQLAQLEGVYVPSLYDFEYAEDDSIASITAVAGAPEKVVRRYVKDIDAFPTYTVIQTPETEFKAMFMTETGRGCEVGCKFCVAGYMYRPIRKRKAETVRDSIQLGMEKSESVGFVGAAVSSHSHIAELASEVAERGKRAALSSIMTQKVTPKLAGSLSESEYKTVALAPEAGSQELRFRIGKRVLDEQILEGIETLASSGIRNFKLYFMVGLPSEEESDVQAIVDLVAMAKDRALAAARTQDDFKVAPKIILSVNPFIPKAWTPFQRHGFMGFSELKKRLKRIRLAIGKMANVEMKYESPRESYFQGVLSRGDRRVGDILRYMHENCLDWRWLVKNGQQRVLEHVPEPEFYVRRLIDAEETLPWEVVDMQIKRSLLERQYERTFTDDVAPLIDRAVRSKAADKKARETSAASNSSKAGGLLDSAVVPEVAKLGLPTCAA
jgi:radical SAM superfamily enzyme YgiQ (UPF0313 family)